jgi:hypothetical protein
VGINQKFAIWLFERIWLVKKSPRVQALLWHRVNDYYAVMQTFAGYDQMSIDNETAKNDSQVQQIIYISPEK